MLISMSRFGKVHFYFCRMLLMLCILCAFPPLEADFYTGLSSIETSIMSSTTFVVVL